MSVQGKIKRISLIIEMIQRGLYPTKKDLLTHLEDHDFNISGRQLDRDKEQLRDEFGVEITYSQERKGYFIDTENSPNMESYLHFFEISNSASILIDSLKESEKTLQYLSFDKGGGLKGIEQLKPILKAITKHNEISFTHFNFHRNTNKKRSLKPYLLKEYLNRWYVVGARPEDGKFRNYAIDRMSNIELTPNTFIPIKKEEVDVL